MTVSLEAFKEVMGLFPTGVTVVTTEGLGDEPYGVTVSAFASVSLDPKLVLICLDNRLSGIDRFLPAGRFAVNILSEDQTEISTHFATSGSDRSEKSGFYTRSASGLPILRESMAWMECRLAASYPAGDHTILVGEVQDAGPGRHSVDRGPLLYYRRRYTGLSGEMSPPLTVSDHKSEA